MNSESQKNGNAASRQVQVVLREGTYIGPLRGRFVNRGQRWRLIIDASSNSSVPSASGRAQLIQGGIAREIMITENTLLARTREERDRSAYATSDVPEIGRATGERDNVSLPVNTAMFESIIVVENLMLDRIADAIEDDPQDDYWTITGRVTEFQDENRLILLTAYRAPGERTSPR